MKFKNRYGLSLSEMLVVMVLVSIISVVSMPIFTQKKVRLNQTEAPVGTIYLWPGNSMPSSDYMECNGQAISRTTYSELFALISTTYGVGNGSTTFNLPDYRAATLAGYDISSTNWNSIGKVNNWENADSSTITINSSAYIPSLGSTSAVGDHVHSSPATGTSTLSFEHTHYTGYVSNDHVHWIYENYYANYGQYSNYHQTFAHYGQYLNYGAYVNWGYCFLATSIKDKRII